jgi:hypothetical protein
MKQATKRLNSIGEPTGLLTEGQISQMSTEQLKFILDEDRISKPTPQMLVKDEAGWTPINDYFADVEREFKKRNSAKYKFFNK